MNPTLRQLKAFVTAADYGSFTRAAEALNLTQSALSGLMKELEHNLGLKLFDRTTRQLHLSEAGGHLLPQARRILNELSAFGSEVRHLKSSSFGQVRIAVSQQLAASALPALLAAFIRQYPEIQVSLIDCSVEQVLQRVQDNEADFGIGPERSHGSDIDSQTFFTLPFFVVLPPQHPAARQPSVRWSQLAGESLITLSSPFTDRLAAGLPEAAADHINHPEYRVNFLSTALAMTKAGLGLTFCLPFAADWVRQHGLVMRLMCEPTVERRFCLYRRKHRSLPPAAQTLRQFLCGCAQTAFADAQDQTLPHRD